MKKLQPMANKDKNRKSEAQDRFDDAVNAGRFAGDSDDAQKAKQKALKGKVEDTTGYDSSSVQNDNGRRGEPGDEYTNASARRGDADAQDFAGNAQNVNAGEGRPLNDDELKKARNKADQNKGGEDTL